MTDDGWVVSGFKVLVLFLTVWCCVAMRRMLVFLSIYP